MRLKATTSAFFLLLVSIVGVGATPTQAEVVGECPEITDSITRLYSATFLRDPATDPGFQFWVDEYSTGRRNMRRIADFFVVSPEFQATYGETSNEQFVDLVYQNVLGRAPDPSGGPFWRGRLDDGYPRGAMMIGFSESKEYVDNTATVRPLAGYGRIYPNGTRFNCGDGPADFAITRPAVGSFVDVLAINATAGESDIVVTTNEASGRLNATIFDSAVIADLTQTPFGPDDVLTDFVRTVSSADGDTDRIRVVTSGPGMHWTVVLYPTSILATRPGWNHPDDDIQNRVTATNLGR
jgi:hypothetical protein